MTKSHWLGLGVLLLGGSIGVQAQRSCASHDLLLQQMADDPKRATVMARIEDHIARFEANGGGATESAVVTIPTVVHVVYNNSTENISDAQVLSQIRILNEDFRRTNSDADGTWPQAADTEIEFCLATIDPNGNATTGITRTSTSNSSFSAFSDNVKFNSSGGKDAWPRDQYLNIWVCDLSSGLLGYAQFPGGPASTDGVVCDYAYFGDVGVATPPFDLGRTATHEVGHWLNLRHIWGDGGCSVDDGVSDTPASDGPNYGCALGTVSCSSTDMVQNYMDYSDDGCMNLFTAGQKTRMQAVLAPGGPRNSLLSAGVCGTPPEPTCTDGIQNGLETGVDCGGPDCPACPPCTDVTVSINLDNYPQETSWQITNSSGTVVASGGTYGSLPDGSNVTEVNCLTDGCYTFTINDTYGDGICCGFGTGDYTVSVAGAGIVASGGSFAFSESTPFCIGGGGGGCSAPTGLTVVGTTSSSASLAWNATAGALGYQAQGRRAGTSTFRQRTTGTNSLTVPGLPAATTFEWQVRVQCGDGTISPWSALSTFTTTTLREGAVADVRLYPNPASSRVRVEGLPQGEVWYRVVDRTGRLVANGQYTDGPAPLELNTESLADGLYLLQWHSLEQQGGIDLLIAH